MKLIESSHPIYRKVFADKAAGCLYRQGSIRALDSDHIQVGIIGSRAISGYTFDILPGIVQFLSLFKCNIISGGALGVDTFAHSLALQFKLNTTAFVACPLDKLSPKQNLDLFQEIQSHGCLLSSLSPHTTVKKHQFLDRNKLLVNLCDFLIVPQAQCHSGSLKTAEYALAQNKQVFVPPVRNSDLAFDGNLILLQKGAKLLTRPDDLINHSQINQQYNQLLKPHLKKHQHLIRGYKNMQATDILEALFKKIFEGKLNYLP